MGEMARRRREEAKRIGARIAQLREERHLTQQAAAERAKVGYRTYQSWESGERTPRWHNYEKLAKAFRVPVDDIIGVPPSEDGRSRGDIDARLTRVEGLLEDVLAAVSLLADPDQAEEDAARLAEEEAAQREQRHDAGSADAPLSRPADR